MSANNTREFSEINIVLDNEIMTAEQILQEMILSMTTQELKENWEHIKQNWELNYDQLEICGRVSRPLDSSSIILCVVPVDMMV